MTTVTITIPDELSESFPTLSDLQRALFEDFIIVQRQQGKISLEKAAELLGISYTDFFDLLGDKGIPFINATREELDESYRHFRQAMNRARP